MTIIYATDRTSKVRKPWICDIRGTGCDWIASTFGNDGMRGLTDSVWIAPGTVDFDVDAE